ncbi:hypothetical protein SDC9_205902 [bioreactor metagenome]|uniref:Uncharacterized protein n=1 Tax=bioreactor metagenome TaxID=1076179 RepID=A0A645J3J4_9ZZZZ
MQISDSVFFRRRNVFRTRSPDACPVVFLLAFCRVFPFLRSADCGGNRPGRMPPLLRLPDAETAGIFPGDQQPDKSGPSGGGASAGDFWHLERQENPGGPGEDAGPEKSSSGSGRDADCRPCRFSCGRSDWSGLHRKNRKTDQRAASRPDRDSR